MDTIILKPNEERARQAMLLIAIVLLCYIANIISSVLQLVLLLQVEQGVEVSDEALEQNDLREQIVAIITLVTFIVSVVTFIRWFRRSYYNLQQLTITSYTHKDAAIVWFIPIINLFRPYKIMKELYTSTWKLLQTKAKYQATSIFYGFVNLWWTLWIISTISGHVSFRLTKNAENLEEFINVTYANLADNLINIPLSLVTMKVIHQYHSWEKELPNLEKEQDSDSVLGDLL